MHEEAKHLATLAAKKHETDRIAGCVAVCLGALVEGKLVGEHNYEQLPAGWAELIRAIEKIAQEGRVLAATYKGHSCSTEYRRLLATARKRDLAENARLRELLVGIAASDSVSERVRKKIHAFLAGEKLGAPYET